MTWKRQTEGRPVWLTRIGPSFLVMVEPAAKGFRADLLFAGGNAGVKRIAFYETEADALARSVGDAKTLLRAAADAEPTDDGLVTLPAGGLAKLRVHGWRRFLGRTAVAFIVWQTLRLAWRLLLTPTPGTVLEIGCAFAVAVLSWPIADLLLGYLRLRRLRRMRDVAARRLYESKVALLWAYRRAARAGDRAAEEAAEAVRAELQRYDAGQPR